MFPHSIQLALLDIVHYSYPQCQIFRSLMCQYVLYSDVISVTNNLGGMIICNAICAATQLPYFNASNAAQNSTVQTYSSGTGQSTNATEVESLAKNLFET